MKDAWEKIDDYTFRLCVPGGWLYRYHYGQVFRIVFVAGKL